MTAGTKTLVTAGVAILLAVASFLGWMVRERQAVDVQVALLNERMGKIIEWQNNQDDKIAALIEKQNEMSETQVLSDAVLKRVDERLGQIWDYFRGEVE